MFFCSAVPGQESQAAVASSCPKPAIGPAIPLAPDRSGAPIIVYARQLDASNDEQGEARGHVELYRADQYLSTEQILFHPTSKEITLPVAVAYEDQQGQGPARALWF